MRVKYKTAGLLISLIVLISGCSIKPNVGTSIMVYPKDDPLTIKILSDADQTSIHFFGAGNHRIYNNNYRHAFGIAALSAQELGYKYFRVIFPEELQKQYKARGATDARTAINSCTQGEGSYTTVSFLGYTKLCNSIVNTYSQHTLSSGTVRHAEVYFWVQMSKEFKNDNVTFSAEDVLAQKDVQKILKEHPEKLDKIKKYLLKYKK